MSEADGVRRESERAAWLPALLSAPGSPLGRFQWFFFAYYIALSGFTVFRNAYLVDLGLTGGQMGAVGFVLTVGGLLAQPVWGATADRTGARRAVLLLGAAVSGVAVLAYPAAAWVADPFVVILAGSLAFTVFRAPLVPVANAMVLADGLDYGRVRAFGSVSFGVGSLSLGVVATAFGTGSVMYVYAAGMVALAAIAWGLPDRGGSAAGSWGAAFGLVRDGRFALLVGVVFLLGVALRSMSAYFSVYVPATGASDALTGSAWALRTVFEAAVFAGAATLGLSNRRFLVVGGLALATAAFGYAFAPTTPVVIGLQVAHGVGFALIYLGAVELAGVLADDGRGSTAQTVLTAAGFGAGGAVGEAAAGLLYESVGAIELYVYLGGVALVGSLAALAIRAETGE